MDVEHSQPGSITKRRTQALVEMGCEEQLRLYFFYEIQPLGRIDVASMQHRNSRFSASGSDASGSGEKSDKLRKRRDRPDVDRIENSTSGKIGRRSTQEARPGNHHAATANNTCDLKSSTRNKPSQNSVSKQAAAAQKNHAKSRGQFLPHSSERAFKAESICSCVWPLPMKKRSLAAFSETAG